MSRTTILSTAHNMESRAPDAMVWQDIRRQLEEKQQEIINEIRAYPFPIPACDVQYNYLLEVRTAIRQELRNLDGLLQQVQNRDEPDVVLRKFVHTSRFLDDASP